MPGFPSCAGCCQRHYVSLAAPRALKWKLRDWGEGADQEREIEGSWRALKGCSSSWMLLTPTESSLWRQGESLTHGFPQLTHGQLQCTIYQTYTSPHSAAGSLTAGSSGEGAHTAKRLESAGEGETTNLSCRAPLTKTKEKLPATDMVYCRIKRRHTSFTIMPKELAGSMK